MKKNVLDEVNISRETDQILHSQLFQEAFMQSHHLNTTVAEHSADVARSALKLCNMLEKHGIAVNTNQVVIASLCHDLGMIGRDDKFDNARECCSRHPVESVEAAREILGGLDKDTAGMIRTHMWPLCKERPSSKEAVIVNLCDKHESVKETIKHIGQRSWYACIAIRNVVASSGRV